MSINLLDIVINNSTPVTMSISSGPTELFSILASENVPELTFLYVAFTAQYNTVGIYAGTFVFGSVQLPFGCWKVNSFTLTGQNIPVSVTTTVDGTTFTTPVDLGPGPGPYDIFLNWNPNLSPPNAWSNQPCCLHKDSLVRTLDGLKPIKLIESGDLVIDEKGKPTTVIFNIKHMIRAEKFVKIEKDAFGNSTPSSTLYVTHEHPILFKGREVPAHELVNGSNVTLVNMPKTQIYTLCTEKRKFVLIQNLPVSTYSEKSWKLLCENGNQFWTKK